MKEMNESIPKFKDEDEEREFWATHSPLDYFDATQSKRALFPDLKPSLKPILDCAKLGGYSPQVDQSVKHGVEDEFHAKVLSGQIASAFRAS
jgi:hypothetical protein